mmetsp:Transcript_148/g.449  ORF Transcript_148/g.449 Transcript_148/m.449 type:complete len:310 (-) Transcript_148:36-965(-)
MARTPARTTAMSGGKARTRLRPTLHAGRSASRAHAARAHAALAASSAPATATSHCHGASTATSSPWSHRPGFTCPLLKVRIPIPSGRPSRHSPLYCPPDGYVYTPRPLFRLASHSPSYRAPDGYTYTPRPSFAPVLHSPSYSPPSWCVRNPRSPLDDFNSTVANKRYTRTNTTIALSTSYTAATARPVAPNALSMSGYAKRPRFTPMLPPVRSVRSFNMRLRNAAHAQANITAEWRSGKRRTVRVVPSSTAPAPESVMSSAAGKVTRTTNRSSECPSSTRRIPVRLRTYPASSVAAHRASCGAASIRME